eukprot:g41001.t1
MIEWWSRLDGLNGLISAPVSYGLREDFTRAVMVLTVIALVMDTFTDIDILKDLHEACRRRRVPVYILLDQFGLPLFQKMCRDAGVRVEEERPRDRQELEQKSNWTSHVNGVARTAGHRLEILCPYNVGAGHLTHRVHTHPPKSIPPRPTLLPYPCNPAFPVANPPRLHIPGPYGQFSMVNPPNLHIFELWEETRA